MRKEKDNENPHYHYPHKEKLCVAFYINTPVQSFKYKEKFHLEYAIYPKLGTTAHGETAWLADFVFIYL